MKLWNGIFLEFYRKSLRINELFILQHFIIQSSSFDTRIYVCVVCFFRILIVPSSINVILITYYFDFFRDSKLISEGRYTSQEKTSVSREESKTNFNIFSEWINHGHKNSKTSIHVRKDSEGSTSRYLATANVKDR